MTNEFVHEIHRDNRAAGWWSIPEGADVPIETAATKLCLIHAEISEALEGLRKDCMDNHLPHRKMAEVELADAVIRIADLAGALGYDVEGAIAEKRAYNKTRADHQLAARNAANGKKI